MDAMTFFLGVVGAFIFGWCAGAFVTHRALKAGANSALAKLMRDPEALEEHAQGFAAAAEEARDRRRARAR